MTTMLAWLLACGADETGPTFDDLGGSTSPQAPEGGGSGEGDETGGPTVPFDTGRLAARPPPETPGPELPR